MKRRDILKTLSVLPIAGGLATTGIPLVAAAAEPAAKRDLFQELGLRTFVNAAGNYTVMTGSLMPQEVLDAISGGAQKFALLDDVQNKVTS